MQHAPVPEDDGLVTPEVGAWSKAKYHFLARYLDLFSTGMKNKWPERHYVDLFAGAGYVKVRDSGELLFGSTLLAATTKTPFTRIHACEQDPQKYNALRQRLLRVRQPSELKVYLGDSNRRADDIISAIPRSGALVLTFVDPYGLHFDFETAAKIASVHSDMIILMADQMDAMRNWAAYYRNNPDSSLDRFIGEPGWRETLQDPTGDRATRLRKRYIARLAELGLSHSDTEPIHNDTGRSIYSLVFASRSKKGLEFWNKARSVDKGGQRRLFVD